MRTDEPDPVLAAAAKEGFSHARPTPPAAGTAPDPTRMARIMFVGDFMLAQPLDAGTEPPPHSAPLVRLMRAAAHVTGNLEMVLTDRGTQAYKPSTVALRGSPGVAGELRRFGLDAVSLANNHTMDFGRAGLRDTLRALAAHGVASFGAGRTHHAATRALVVKVGDTRVALVGLSCTLPPGAKAEADEPGVAGIRVDTRFDLDPRLMMEQPGTAPRVRTTALDHDVTAAQAAVRTAARRADIVIAVIHWGVPPAAMNTFLGGELADYQRPLGHALIDAGAAAVVGHHPHAVHGVELHRGRPIAYSLGHIAFSAQMDFMSHTGVIADLGICPDGATDVRFWPLQVAPDGTPQAPSPQAATTILHALAASSVRLDTELSIIAPPHG